MENEQRTIGSIGGLDDLAVDELSVDGIIVPVAALAPSTESSDLFAGLQQFAHRWM